MVGNRNRASRNAGVFLKCSSTHRIDGFMLGESHWCNAINTHCQNGDEYVNERYPICKERPEKQNRKHRLTLWASPKIWKKWLNEVGIPVVIHVLYLLFHVAVDTLAICSIGQLSHHSQSIRSFFSCKELLYRHGYALASPLTVHTHYLLPQSDFRGRCCSLLNFSPATL